MKERKRLNSCSNGMGPRICSPILNKGKEDSYAKIVEDFLKYNGGCADAYLHFYQNQPSLEDAITKSALAEMKNGKRFSHQRRIPRQVLLKAKDQLMRLSFDKFKSFEELYENIFDSLSSIRGIGNLTIYDTTHRLGAYLGLSPRFIYVHAGVREGVKGLSLDHRRNKIEVSELPKEFHVLSAEQAEDCLCAFKDRITALKLKTELRAYKSDIHI